MTEEDILMPKDDAIKILKKISKDLKNYELVKIDVKTFVAIDTVLNLIEKQQQDIEKLRKVINVEKVMCENMIGDVEIVCMYKDNFLRNYGDDYISKDKIRGKIKELEDTIKKKRQLNIKEWIGFEENEIEILEELLGEEDE